MVKCPNCGIEIRKTKLLTLTNFNSVTCQTCNARSHVKNKDINSVIGGVGGGVGAGLLTLLLIFSFRDNLSYLFLIIPVFALLLVAVWIAVDKFVKLELEIPPPPPP